MSFIWEESTVNGTLLGESTNFTLTRYHLYTRDIQLSRGGTAGFYWDQNNTGFTTVHPNYYRDGIDTHNEWLMVANWEESSQELIEVWVQSIFGSFIPSSNSQPYKGKRLLIPLNSGPSTLSTRSDDDFIMSTPSYSSELEQNWCAVKAGTHATHGFTENDLVQPSVRARRPYTASQPAYNGNITFTETEAHDQRPFRFYPQTFPNFAGYNNLYVPDFPEGGGQLQNPLASWQDVNEYISSSIWTGGSFVLYAQVRNSTQPVTAELSIKAGATTILAFGAATLVETVVPLFGNPIFIYRRVGTPTISVDTDIFATYGVRNLTTGFNFRDSGGNPITTGIGTKLPLADPWINWQSPPPYTVTSNNGKAVKGGYL